MTEQNNYRAYDFFFVERVLKEELPIIHIISEKELFNQVKEFDIKG
jgi:hypothetical protein